jgi:hypothetical protein
MLEETHKAHGKAVALRYARVFMPSFYDYYY